MTTWTAPEAHRVQEPSTGPERAMLQGWLDFHRQTLLAKCAGLTGEQLKQASVEPSILTLLGLVRHMTEVEKSWFRERFLAEDVTFEYGTDDQLDGDFENVADADAEANYAAYLAEIATVDKAVADAPLDQEWIHRGSPRSLRWIYLHLIEEYARHNGHADLIRERIDGATGD